MEKLIASGPIIIEDGYLLVTRDWKDEFYKLPGGRLQEGEDLENCALRRFREETGFDAEITEELSTMYLDKKPVTGEDIEMELHHFRAELVERPENLEGFDYADYEVKWLNIRDIIEGRHNVAPNIDFLIEKGEIEPWIDYVVGKKKKFFEFIDMITPRDKVAIVTHTDLDGLASAVFLEEILQEKKIEVEFIDFLSIGEDMVKKKVLEWKEEGFSKIFFCDLPVDVADSEGLEDLAREMDFFILDHHPVNLDVEIENRIKSDSSDCTAMLVFGLGRDFLDVNEWDWLLGAAIFSDYSYKSNKNFEILKRIYPEVTRDNISGSIPGINARKINSATIYYENDLDHVYELVKKRELDKLSEVHELIEEEVDRIIEDFSKREKYYPEKNLHLYEIKSSFKINSTISTLISKMKSRGTFIFYQKRKSGFSVSGRNQEGKVDVGLLLKECTEGLEEASGGGHKAAAGAQVKEKDLDLFLDRLVNHSSFDIGGVY